MSGVLGLGSDGSSGLTQQVIDDLKDKEYEAYVSPIETDLEEISEEALIIDEIESKTLELLTTISPFDLYVSGGTTAFDEVSATTSGSSASFDATDTSGLTEGTLYIEIEQLATKDVYQSNKISESPDDVMLTGQGDNDQLTISIDGETFDFLTKDLTYEELAENISSGSSGKLVSSVEYVSDDEFRIVIKSADTGESNAISITQSVGVDLGFDLDANHTLTAQNMYAVIDGVDYDVSSNTIETQDGLSITGVSLGDSSITISKDYSSITETMEQFVAQYNELVDLIDDAIYLDESPVEDKSSLRMMMSGIKDIFFTSFGLDDEESAFNYGFGFDTDGYMTLDSTTFASALSDNPDDLKELFVGYAEKEGLGTQLKTYLDNLDGYDGILYSYEESMAQREENLEEEKEKAIENIDEKYEYMQLQFAETTALITQMETEFSSLLAIIEGDS